MDAIPITWRGQPAVLIRIGDTETTATVAEAVTLATDILGACADHDAAYAAAFEATRAAWQATTTT